MAASVHFCLSPRPPRDPSFKGDIPDEVMSLRAPAAAVAAAERVVVVVRGSLLCIAVST